jgi:hypothetical protein
LGKKRPLKGDYVSGVSVGGSEAIRAEASEAMPVIPRFYRGIISSSSSTLSIAEDFDWKKRMKEREADDCLPERHGVVAIELEIQIVESLALAAVDLVDPLADPGLLVENGPVQTEELYVHDLV